MGKGREGRRDPPLGEGIPPRILKLIREIAEKYGSTLEKLLGPSCRAEEVFPRHEAIRAVAKLVEWSPWSWKKEGGTGWSLPRIAKVFNRDHSTVLYILNGRYKKRPKKGEGKETPPKQKVPYAGKGKPGRRKKESKDPLPLPLFPLLPPSRGK